MKRLALLLVIIVMTAPNFGCGSKELPPADRSNLPPEVKEFEDKMDQEAARREAVRQKKATKASSQ